MRIFTWKEKLGKPECPYLVRWVLNLGLFSVRLHHWVRSDDRRHRHDHPWWFITIVLSGGYFDQTDSKDEWLPAGSIRLRKPLHKHIVYVPPGGCWTVLLTGPRLRNWGFYVGKKWKKSNKYFLEHGDHPCE